MTAGVGFGIAIVTTIAAAHGYRHRINLSVLDDVPLMVACWSTVTVVALTVSGITPTVAFAGGAALLTGRTLTYQVARVARASGYLKQKVLIIGGGQVGKMLADRIEEHPSSGLETVAVLDPNPIHPSFGVPIWGSMEELPTLLEEENIDIALIAFSNMPEHHMIDILRSCDRHDAEVFVVPRLFELQQAGLASDNVRDVPLVKLRRGTHRSKTWPMKRAFDIITSSVALIALLPVLALIAVAVRWDGGPGVIFKQERVGADGKHVKVLKFRTMRPTSEQESDTRWSIDGDPRVTPLGRFLRQTSLDELPQLVNILRGDMSVVGPRPERPHFVNQFSDQHPHYNARHRVPCGLTGLAQVRGMRGDTSVEERAFWDNQYIQNWSLWLDLKIVVQTITQVFTRAGN